MSVIKQISVFNGSDWNTGDIGADASNIDISSAILGSGTNVQSALTTIGNKIGTTAIPSRLGTTITGAINTLNTKLAMGYAEYANLSLANKTWIGNTGTMTSGVKPSGSTTSGYNLTLDVAGTYLIIYHANFLITNNDGFRGIRFYKNENNIGEEYIAPSWNGTQFTTVRFISSNGSDYIRMGLYSHSNDTQAKQVSNINITAIKIA